MRHNISIIPFVALLFFLATTFLKTILIIIAFKLMPLDVFTIFYSTPWWVKLIYLLIIFSGIMFIYSWIEEYISKYKVVEKESDEQYGSVKELQAKVKFL